MKRGVLIDRLFVIAHTRYFTDTKVKVERLDHVLTKITNKHWSLYVLYLNTFYTQSDRFIVMFRGVLEMIK